MTENRTHCQMAASIFLTLALGAAFGCAGQASRLTTDGPLGDTVELTNGHVRLVVAPEVGRIVAYHRIGRTNVLWLGPQPADLPLPADKHWQNPGGARAWVLPEGSTRRHVLGREWPPDETFDGQPWQVIHHDELSLTMQSATSPYSGLRMTQTISLLDEQTTVKLVYRLEQRRTTASPLCHIWPIAQTPMPDYALLRGSPRHPRAAQTFGGQWSGDRLSLLAGLPVMRYAPPPKQNAKVGIMGRWIAAVHGQQAFVQFNSPVENAKYHDGANCEIFTDPLQQMMELEILGPVGTIAPGQQVRLTVFWKLVELRNIRDEQDVYRVIEAACPIASAASPGSPDTAQ